MLGRIVQVLLTPLEWFYPTAKLIYRWRTARRHLSFGEGPVLILQMGKVGSKSVFAGVSAAGLDRPIYHAHFLSADRTAKTESQRRKFFRTERYSYLKRPWLNQFLLQRYNSGDSDRVWKIVTLTREPVGRNISAFFENLEFTPLSSAGTYEISSDYYQIEPTVVSVDDMTTLAHLFYARARHDSALRFFNREIRDIFGIDVLCAGFPIDNGYKIYKSDRAELLVLRLESLAECAGVAFKEFLGIEDFKIINRNIGAKKVYAPLYDAFKRSGLIVPDYADRLYNSEYTRTFYSAREIAAVREKWAGLSEE